MTSAPAPMAPEDETALCHECGRRNQQTDEFCTTCGADLDAAPQIGLAPLVAGTVLDDSYVIDSVEPHGSENQYRVHRLHERNERLRVRERRPTESGCWRTVAERTATLSHPALLLPESVFEEADREYVVSPERAGIRLATRLGRTTEREAISWGVQLCQAVGFLHRHGLLCVELPPDAVLVDREGRLRITQIDGLHTLGGEGSHGAVTDGYGAPEVYKGGELAPSTDVFAIGALLYALVVGCRLPVEGWIVDPEPPLFYPEKVVSAGLERVLRRALAADNQDRFPTADALKAALLDLNRVVRVRSAWLTDVGLTREHNEDAVLVAEYGHGTVAGTAFCGLYVVSDGMGGAEAGEVASALTIQQLSRHVEQARAAAGVRTADDWEEELRLAVDAANTRILGYALEHPQSEGLGATVVAALVQSETVVVAWVGDSRAYLLERGRLHQLTRDHSLVSRLVAIGQLTPAEALTHEHRNVLIRSLGSKAEANVDIVQRRIPRGARLLLCSDGLTSHVRDEALADILGRHRDPYAAALELVVAANTGGGSDNISVVVVFHD